MIQINDEKYKSLEKHTNHHGNIQIITETFNSSKNIQITNKERWWIFFVSKNAPIRYFLYAFCRFINTTRQMSLNKLIYWGWGITLRIRNFNLRYHRSDIGLYLSVITCLVTKIQIFSLLPMYCLTTISNQVWIRCFFSSSYPISICVSLSKFMLFF